MIINFSFSSQNLYDLYNYIVYLLSFTVLDAIDELTQKSGIFIWKQFKGDEHGGVAVGITVGVLNAVDMSKL